jgi:hypothetical protein
MFNRNLRIFANLLANIKNKYACRQTFRITFLGYNMEISQKDLLLAVHATAFGPPSAA